MDVVDRIFHLVDERFQEQREFATLLGVYPSMISSWRTRKSASYQKRISEIADILGTTVDYLLTGEKKEPTTVTGDGPDPEVLEMLRRISPEQMEEVKRYLRFQAEQREKP